MNIVLKDVCKSFPGVRVLDKLNMTFEDGTLTTILGPSGCGKTTILNLISGVLAPDSGEIRFGDTCVNNVPMAERKIGYVFQNYSLYPSMTAYENIRFPLVCRPPTDIPRRQRKAFFDGEVRRIARLMQIEPLLERYPAEMSGGQQQRVAIARAILRRPNILLMDEPFANLDRKLSIHLREEVRAIQQKTGITTVFVTHNQADANAISSRIILMRAGAVQQEGDPEALYDCPANLFAADFFGEYSSNILTVDEAATLFPAGLIGAPSGACHVAFRPEYARFTLGEGSLRLTGVRRVGPEWLCQLEAGQVRLLAFSDAKPPVGSAGSVLVPAERFNYYDSTGNRMPPP